LNRGLFERRYFGPDLRCLVSDLGGNLLRCRLKDFQFSNDWLGGGNALGGNLLGLLTHIGGESSGFLLDGRQPSDHLFDACNAFFGVCGVRSSCHGPLLCVVGIVAVSDGRPYRQARLSEDRATTAQRDSDIDTGPEFTDRA
jgi:hypothetical protein